MQYVFPVFMPPNFMLLKEETGNNMIAAPNCWGGYGITINMDKVAEEDSDSIYLLYNPKYKGHLCVSARFEENIALTGILVCHRMGTKDKPRPDGKPFNPYVLYDNELAECKKLLIEQKKYLAHPLERRGHPGTTAARPGGMGCSGMVRRLSPDTF